MRYAIAMLMLFCSCAWGQVEFVVESSVKAIPVTRKTNGTFSLWASIPSTNNIYGFISCANAGSDVLYSYVRLQKDQFRFIWYNRTWPSDFVAVTNIIIAIDTLYHFAITSDGTQYRMYIDGVEYPVTVISGSNSGNWLGDASFDDFVDINFLNRIPPIAGKQCFINDARLYDRCLSATEIKSIHGNRGCLPNDPDLVLRTCVLTTNDTYSTLSGVAPNYGSGTDGTYRNSPTAAPRKIRIRKPMGMIP